MTELDPYILPLTAVAAIVIGALLGWTGARSRAAVQAAAAAAQACAPLQAELATLTERATSLTAALNTERQEHLTAQQTLDNCRKDYDEASNVIARLQERADQQGAQFDLARSSLAEHTQRLEMVSSNLSRTSEERAGLETQVRRLQSVEQELGRLNEALETERKALAALRAESGAEVSSLKTALQAEKDSHALVRKEYEEARASASQAMTRVAALTEELTELRTRTETERAHAEERLQLLTKARDELSLQFRNLANEILEEKSKRFTEQNQSNIGQLLDPLRAQLADFKVKVEEVYVQEGKDRSTLAEQVRQLVALNETLSEDAKNLTQALKGQAKTQGNWGELILESVLEASGLRKGYEYKVQDSQVREDGSRAQPDVVIELPENRSLVVDAKVSLVTYERWASSSTDEERAQAGKQHVASLRSHIKGLSDKSYEKLYGVKSLDFVLLFVPIEPAFMLAVSEDDTLFMEAWQRNVLLVSPSTLLFVVRTVAHLWRQEAQKRNAVEIAERGGKLYDKLMAFADDLQSVGDAIVKAQKAFEDAKSKLILGKGNVIRQAEMLRELGVPTTKSLPKKMQAEYEDDADNPLVDSLPSVASETVQTALSAMPTTSNADNAI